MEGNLHIPIIAPLHETLGDARTQSTFVQQRIAGEPRQGPITSVPAPAPSSFGGGDDVLSALEALDGFGGKNAALGKVGVSDGLSNSGKLNPAADSSKLDALAALEGGAGSR